MRTPTDEALNQSANLLLDMLKEQKYGNALAPSLHTYFKIKIFQWHTLMLTDCEGVKYVIEAMDAPADVVAALTTAVKLSSLFG